MSAAPAPTTTHGRQWLLPVATALLLAALATILPAVEIDAEADRYHERAERLLRGELPGTPFHPLGLPLLITLVLPLVGDSLWAGRLLSAAAAGWLVLLTGVLAERLRPGAGGVARWLLAGNAIVWSCGTMASSDMVAASLGTAAIVLLATGDGPLRGRQAFGLGLLLGAAIAMRHAAWFMVPLLTVWAWRRGPGVGGIARIGSGLAIGSAPHWLLQPLAPATPGIAAWHNLYLRTVCGFDLEQLHRAQQDGSMPEFGAFLAQHGTQLLQQGLATAVDSTTTMLAPMLLGLPSAPWAITWPLLPALLGWLHPRTRPVGRWLLGLAALTTLAVATSSLPRPRLLLPVLPLLVAGSAAAIAMVTAQRLRQLLCVAAVVATAWCSMHSFRARWRDYPTAEVELARSLAPRMPLPFGVLTTFAMLDRHIPQRVYGLFGRPPLGTAPDQPTAAPSDSEGRANAEFAAATWSWLRQRLQTTGAEVFVTGRASHAALHTLLAHSAVPADFRRLQHGDGAVAVVLELSPSPWIANCSVDPGAVPGGRSATVGLELSATADRSRLVAAGLVLRAPDGTETMFDLPATPDGRFVRALHWERAGRHWLSPFLLLGDGSLQRWQAMPIDVTGP